MRKFKLSVHRFRLKLIEDAERAYGFADMETIESQVKRYAIAKAKHKRGDFDPFTDELERRRNQSILNVYTDDGGCKSCRKKKR